jgi:hypothetical protein
MAQVPLFAAQRSKVMRTGNIPETFTPLRKNCQPPQRLNPIS